MSERYPDGSLSHIYGDTSNWDETHLGLSLPIPTPDHAFLDAEETMRFVLAFEAPSKATTAAQAAAVQLYRETMKEL